MNIIMLSIAAYALLASVYLLVMAISALLRKEKEAPISSSLHRILIMLPVYKEDEVILASARKALLLPYDKAKFDVAVIADSLMGTTTTALKEMGCMVINMNLTPRSKAKAINLALRTIPEQYDICVILDADNYLSEQALFQINDLYCAGAKAIQCQRVAKEITTPVSVLDALSEGINNSIFRKGHRAWGLSAALAGSGMAFDYAFFKELMRRIVATNGFDKDLEFEVMSSGTKIQYLENVSVYDEKVDSLEVLKKQRTRWFAAQIINIRKGFLFFIKHPSVDLLDKWWQMFLPSRLLLVGALMMLTLIFYISGNDNLTKTFGISAFTTGLALVIAAPIKYLRGNWSAIMQLPVSFFVLAASFFSIGKARKGFIHTPHHSPKV
jgi:cellulose synthase/poly-beta-1,6-N-acetylglucosamine synthase-like glycosyltransferase